MTLGTLVELCGIQFLPVMSEGLKPQLSLEIPELPKVKAGKDKTTGEPIMVHQSISLRALSEGAKYLSKPGKSQEYYEDIADSWLESANEGLFKLTKTKGETSFNIHKSLSDLVEGMQEETESASAADPSNIAAQFIAAMLGKEESGELETIPSEATFLDTLIEKISKHFATPGEVKSAVDLLNEKATNNGRKDSGQISWRKKKAAKTEEAVVPAKTEGELAPATV